LAEFSSYQTYQLLAYTAYEFSVKNDFNNSTSNNNDNYYYYDNKYGCSCE